MFLKKDLSHVKRDIEQFIGSKVFLESNKGRQKSIVNKGIISSVYPSIFTIELFEGKLPHRKLCFSYTDVLTDVVKITLCE